tara:strand:- start:11 stop:538 length:528 start_codon:yes stop_codon:yes gene_type:complete
MTSQTSESSPIVTTPQGVPPSLEFTSPEDLLELATRLDNQVKELKALSGDVKKALKNCSKLAKNGAFAKKQKKVKDPNAPPRAPSGFAKPTKVSKELSTFLGLADGEEIARTDVTKRINAYVKEHNLQNPANKRELVLDDTLQTLLNPPDGETITFFNLQKYMKHHYISNTPNVS